MRVAVIHDWLVVNGGAEKVLEEILKLYPGADFFTLVDHLPTDKRSWLGDSKVITSFIQKLPMSKSKYRNYFPLFPIAIEQFDLSEYDLVLSSSSSVAKGVITGPNQIHICYCHSPARYAWDLQEQYLRESNLESGLKSIVARYFLHKFRIWDIRTINAVDIFIANSKFIKKRIEKYYRRNAVVIYPPVDIARFKLHEVKEDYYLAASRLVPYKRIDLIVEAFTKMPNKKLKVIGDGPQMEKIRSLAKGYNNIDILGYQQDESIVKLLQSAKAYVFAAEEDFGILPVEAQACGTPVIAFGKGGCLETVIDGVTGVHFKEQTSKSIIDAIKIFETSKLSFDPHVIRKHAECFAVHNFANQLTALVNDSFKSN